VLDRLVGQYLVAVGARGVLLWQILRYAAGPAGADGRDLIARNGYGPEILAESFERLLEYRLVEADVDQSTTGPQRLTVRAPLDEATFEAAFVTGTMAFPEAEPGETQPLKVSEPPKAPEPLIKGADLERVLDRFHNRIGILGAQQIMTLREWIEDRGLAAEVLEAAIEKVAESGKRTFNYLEGVLRNLYNSGVRTLADMEADAARPEGRGRTGDGAAASPGIANSGAYVKVDKELIRKWKETHPDVYSS
jgi:DnaD/phage-associated family protein